MPKYIGREIGGYLVMDKVGVGGMAKVYKAYQAAFDRYVALKLLPETYAEDDTYLKRFQREAKVIARLEHKHILPVYDFGEDEGIAFLAMRYLQAGTLKDLLENAPGHKVPLMDTVRIVRQIADALDYAHQQGIVHRDVKPSNVLVDAQGDTYLMDFGIAKVLEATSHLTKEGSVLGTPAYMSPEQGSGKGKVDGRSDIYSLGIMLYEMLVGQVPYNADTPFAVVMAHVTEPLPIPSQVDPDISETLEKVILKTLAKKPEDRYPSARELSKALGQAVGLQVIEEASSEVRKISGELAGRRSIQQVTMDDRKLVKGLVRSRKMRKAVPWMVGVVIIVLLGFGAVILNQARSRTVFLETQAAVTIQVDETSQVPTNATMDSTQAVEIVLQVTETALAYRHETATQSKLNFNQSRTEAAMTETVVGLTETVVALTPSLTPTISNRLYLGDLIPISVRVGWGEFSVGSLVGAMANEAGTSLLRSHGVTYSHGLVTHAPAEVVFNLPEGYSTLYVEILMYDRCGEGDGEVVFLIRGDDRTLYVSDEIGQSNSPLPLEIPINGISALELIVDDLLNDACDWAIWGNPYLVP